MLKVKDYEIRWHHELHQDHSNKMDGVNRCLYQGLTICIIINDNIECPYEGEAICSWDDNFSYDIGRKISLSRALERADLPKKERRLIWEAYRTQMTKKPRW